MGNKLNRNQSKALTALLVNPTVAEAAAAAGLGERTVARYLTNPTFKAALSKRQDAVVSAVTAALAGLAGEALETLHDILKDANATPAVKARVALGWLTQMRQSIELADLVDRIAALERTLE